MKIPHTKTYVHETPQHLAWKRGFPVGAGPLRGTSIDSNIVQGKAESLHDNLKQKEGKGARAREFNASKGWLGNFIKWFGLKNVKITGEAASADQKAVGSSQAPLRKSLRRNGICLKRF